MDNRKIISVSFLIITLSVAYYPVIYIPKRETAKLELEKQKQTDLSTQQALVRAQLDTCLISADAAKYEFWNKTCKDVLGKKEDCLLPQYNADRVEDYGKELKEDCFRKYPQN
jgi:hypothetical protein